VHADAVLAAATLILAGAAVSAVAAARSRHAAPVVGSYLAHLVIGLGVLAVAGVYAPDATAYDQAAQGYADYWSGRSFGVHPNLSAGKEGWVLILAALYRRLGHLPALGLIVNATFCAVATALVMATAVRLGWARHARTAGWLTLLPSSLLWGSLLLREPAAWALTALVGWAAAGLATRWRPGDLGWLLAGLTGELWIRGSLAPVLAAGLLLGVVAARRRVAPALLAGLVVAVAASGPVAAHAQVVAGSLDDLEQLNAARAALSRAGSGFGTSVYAGPADLVLAVPYTLPRAVAGPYPWELPGLPAATVVDWLPWLLLVWWAARGWRRAGRVGLAVAVPALVVLAVIGATSGNYGTMIRLRTQVAVLLAPLAAVGRGSGAPPRPERLSAVAAAVEGATGLTAYDPQADTTFVGGRGPHRRRDLRLDHPGAQPGCADRACGGARPPGGS
jgi:hypothetical protein